MSGGLWRETNKVLVIEKLLKVFKGLLDFFTFLFLF